MTTNRPRWIFCISCKQRKIVAGRKKNTCDDCYKNQMKFISEQMKKRYEKNDKNKLEAN